MERGDRGLSVEWLQRFARALECRPAELLPVEVDDPDHDEQELIRAFRTLSPQQRAALMTIILGLRGESSEG